MKHFVFLFLLIILLSCGKLFAQTITIDLKDAPLEKVFTEISAQSGYQFIFTREQLKKSIPVTIQFRNAPLHEVLDYSFREQELSYRIEDKYVIVLNRPGNENAVVDSLFVMSGRVINEKGAALPGVSVTAVRSQKGTSTDRNGAYTLKGVSEKDILVITCIGYEKEEVAVSRQPYRIITMKQEAGILDETIVMAYGKTTKRLNTGNIGRISRNEIARQPVTDPLAALHGKIPGLLVTQSSGLPGASARLEIRGRSSLSQGSEPLIILDGVPLAANNQPVNSQLSILTTNFSTGLSPIASIDPLTIESIEILKDADATAIYGSRGANGVVLITTRTGVAGKTAVFVNFHAAWARVPQLPEMMDTKEYVAMRTEAISNDGFIPSADPRKPGYAPDLLLWDTLRYTNYTKMFLGNTAHNYNGQVGASGGNERVQVFFSAGYGREGTVFPGSMGNNRISFNNSIHYGNKRKTFSAKLTSGYSNAKNSLIKTSIAPFLSPAPNTPSLYKEDGKLNWEENGYYFDNAAAYLSHSYQAETDHLLSSLQLDYKLLKGLTLRGSFGYNLLQVSEKTTIPIAAQMPIYDPSGKLSVSDNRYKSWIIEPQIAYEAGKGKGKLNILLGSTFFQNTQNRMTVNAGGYRSDSLLHSVTAASTVYNINSYSDYKYIALFGRINYQWSQKYIANISGRRDGSSRFGPGNRFANFGAVGAGWLFHKESFVQKFMPFLSFGKIRGSYGITGNDQVGDYKYLDSWTRSYNTYQGNTTLYPASLYNPLYGWESNKKSEIGIELGVLKDRIYFSSVYFRNRSSNQLVDHALPHQTGFTGIVKNFPAIIRNSGFELQLVTMPVRSVNIKWSLSGNITLPSNKLIRFDGVGSSSYAATYVEGQPLNLIYRLHSLDVDPSNGAFVFRDIDRNGTINIPKDLRISGHTDPVYYGGIRNSFTFNRFELDIFFDFRKQTGLNYLHSVYGNFYIPGFAVNQPRHVLNRWQQPGDVTDIQKFTSTTYSEAYAAKEMLRYSDAIYSDASFLRLKTASVSWHIPPVIFRTVKTPDSKIFLSSQNLFIITGYKGTDPEIQDFYALPALRTLTAGINVTF